MPESGNAITDTNIIVSFVIIIQNISTVLINHYIHCAP
jgi:hypothetical protein